MQVEIEINGKRYELNHWKLTLISIGVGAATGSLFAALVDALAAL